MVLPGGSFGQTQQNTQTPFTPSETFETIPQRDKSIPPQEKYGRRPPGVAGKFSE